MELLIHTVKEHLEHNKRIVVPRLGTFIVKPDGETIVFSELLRDDDGVLRALLAAKGLGELEIDGMIDRMIFNIRHAVSGGKEYAVEGFGTFTTGANGTIRFTSAKHKIVVQGYIKPSIPMSDNTDRREGKAPIAAMYDKSDEHSVKMSRSQIANPDPYLRGLKYDKHKKSEREGTVYVMPGAMQSHRHNILIALIAAITVIGLASYIFIRLRNDPEQEQLAVNDSTYTEDVDTPDPAAADGDDGTAAEATQAGTGRQDETASPNTETDRNRQQQNDR